LVFHSGKYFDRQATSACRFCFAKPDFVMKRIILIVSLGIFTAANALGQTDTTGSKQVLQELVVSGLKANEKTPITFSSINSKTLRKLYYGADIPSLLQVTPSVNMNSDNGTGIGYSVFRLRGMDQTRINTTVNGIPVNDPENQGVYFNNFADLASSAENIQVQRGVGTSTNGSSAFGGSVNISTRNLSDKPGANVFMGIGSFGSSRLTAEVQTGLLNEHWMFYGRMGQVKTDGYRNNSGTQAQSYQFSLGRVSQKSALKFNFFGGNAQSKLAYAGIDAATFKAAPKTNYFVDGESDAFKQYFNQVQYSYVLRGGQSISASAYYVLGGAPKFQFLAPGYYNFTDLNMLSTPFYVSPNGDTMGPGNVMTSYRLNQQYFGGFLNYHLTKGRIDLNAGLHASSFKSDHFMEVNWANLIPANIQQNHQVYFNTGYKKEVSAFAKLNYAVSAELLVFADLQIRKTSFKYVGLDQKIRKEYGKVEDMQWLFFSPKAGAKLGLNQNLSAYVMVGYSEREPTRFDYLQDDFAVRDVKQNEIKPEQVLDMEGGIELKGAVKGKINVFAMEFQNQIVGTGLFNNFGYPVTGNVGRSYRRGIETELTAKANKNISFWLSSSLSVNGIAELNQTYFNSDMGLDQKVVYKNTALALSPSQIHNIGFESNWLNRYLVFGVSYRYVSMQYLDNTQTKALSLAAYQTVDLQLGFNVQRFAKYGLPNVSIKVNNLLNQKYAPAGSLGGYNSIDNAGVRGQSPLYFPAATTYVFCTLSWQF